MDVVGVYAVYDKKCESLVPGSIFTADDDNRAKRVLQSSFNPSSILVQYASDYYLFSCGDVDMVSGTFSATAPDARRLAEVVDLIPVGLRQYNIDGSFTKN